MSEFRCDDIAFAAKAWGEGYEASARDDMNVEVTPNPYAPVRRGSTSPSAGRRGSQVTPHPRRVRRRNETPAVSAPSHMSYADARREVCRHFCSTNGTAHDDVCVALDLNDLS